MSEIIKTLLRSGEPAVVSVVGPLVNAHTESEASRLP